MKNIKVSKLYQQWLGTVDQGKQLELLAADSDGDLLEGYNDPLFTIKADENTEDLYLEIYLENTVVQFPVSEMLAACDTAQGKVHSENWFEKNVYPKE